MKRIDIIYGGVRYTIANRDLAELKAEVADALSAGVPHWLAVNHGEGTLHEAELLITPGVDLAVMGLDSGSKAEADA
ncbi:MAG TPA: hypothetical protein VFT01_02360 [Homoserinimonas sp.]|nr:hypothetical protein [Homoserinimonas sp.]